MGCQISKQNKQNTPRRHSKVSQKTFSTNFPSSQIQLEENNGFKIQLRPCFKKNQIDNSIPPTPSKFYQSQSAGQGSEHKYKKILKNGAVVGRTGSEYHENRERDVAKQKRISLFYEMDNDQDLC